MPTMRDIKGLPLTGNPFNITNSEYAGIFKNHKFGRTEGLANVERTVWTGSITYNFPTVPLAMALASTNSSDICSGSVIKAVKVDYLTASWDMMSETHCLNGLTPVTLSSGSAANILRVNRMVFLSNCAYHVNTGQIWLGTSDWTAGVPAGKYGHIDTGKQQTYQAFYSVPRGFDAKMYDLNITLNSSKQATIWMRSANYSETFSGFSSLKNTYQHKDSVDLFQNDFPRQYTVPKTYPEMTDIEFRATGLSGGGGNVSIEWSMLLVGSAYRSDPAFR